MKVFKHMGLAAGLAISSLIAAPAFAAGGTWTTVYSQAVPGSALPGSGGASIRTATTTLSSPTAVTSPLALNAKSCVTVEYVNTDSSQTLAFMTQPVSVTGVISVTAIAAVTPTANVTSRTNITGVARNLWATAAYGSAAAGTTKIQVTEMTNCTR